MSWGYELGLSPELWGISETADWFSPYYFPLRTGPEYAAWGTPSSFESLYGLTVASPLFDPG